MLLRISISSGNDFIYTLNLEPSVNITDYTENIIEKSPYKALNVIAMYGNYSSFNNFIQNILSNIIYFITNRLKITGKESILNNMDFTIKTHIFFEIKFLIDNIQFRFGIVFSNTNIIAEWLYKTENNEEICLYERSYNTIDPSINFESNIELLDKAIEETNDYTLFLDVCGNKFNFEIASSIIIWFKKLKFLSCNQSNIEYNYESLYYNLVEGNILFVDSLGALENPLQTINTVNLFLNSNTNAKQAQLIFSSCVTSILSHCKLRRDQIYFIDFKQNGLYCYCLNNIEYKDESMKINENIEKSYLEGRFGAVPTTDNF